MGLLAATLGVCPKVLLYSGTDHLSDHVHIQTIHMISTVITHSLVLVILFVLLTVWYNMGLSHFT